MTRGAVDGLGRSWQDLLRAAARLRWLLAGGLAAGAVATALPSLAPPPPPSVQVLVAARDLAAGAPLAPGDLVPAALPRQAVPDGAVRAAGEVQGRLLAGAVRRGEPLTDVRVVGPGLLAAQAGGGLVAVPVRLADPATAALLRAGDRVDVLAAPTSADAPPAAPVVAAAAPVLAVPDRSEADLEGALVVLAAPPATAARLAAAAVSSRLSVVVRGQP